MSPTVLVTGGAGFIGSHLVEALLSDGHEVVVVDDLSTGSKSSVPPGAVFFELDVNDEGLAEVFAQCRPQAVFMLAFNTNVPKSVDDPLFDMRSLTGSLRTFDLSRQFGVARVIVASSSFVYGAADTLPTPEEAPTVPSNPYVITKSATENYAHFYRAAYGLESVIFRLATTYGPRQVGGAMADYIRSIEAGGAAIIYGDGLKTRDYLYVTDVVDAFVAAIGLDLSGEGDVVPVLNLGTGTETTLLDLYREVGRLLGQRNADPDFQPDRPGEIMRTSLNWSRAAALLDWEPRVSLHDGLARTVEAYVSASQDRRSKFYEKWDNLY